MHALVPAAVALLVCLALVPAVVNGDGLGYLKAAPTEMLYPGHLGYLPLLRLLGRLLGGEGSLALLGPARALSMASCALGAAAVAATGRRVVGSPRAGLGAGLGMALSFGALQVGCDVETYAPALASMCVALWAAARREEGHVGWTALVALAVAAAALLHVENVLFAPAAALLVARPRDVARPWRFLDGGAVLAGSGALVLAAYLIAFRARGDDAASAVRWLLGAGHGYAHPLRWWTPLAAIYGMAKTLVYAPYPYQASWARVIAQTLAGVCGLGAVAWLALRSWRAVMPRAAWIAWLAPYLVVGIAFFASENERWIFLLPPVWLAAGAGMASSPVAARVGAALAGALLALDLVLGLPLSRDDSMRARADALAPHVRPGDLVISPGHSWDEYIGFYQSVSLDRFPMIYFCGLLGGTEPMRAELALRVKMARARGATVLLARVDEAEGADGWKELALFGVTPSNVDALLPPGRRVAIAPGLARLDP